MQSVKTAHLSVLCALFALAACWMSASPAKAAQDLSTPKKAALTFARAVEAGDMDGAKASSVGTDDDYAALQSLSDMLGAVKRMQTAMLKNYGNDAKKLSDLSSPMSSQIETAEEKVDGDTATLVVKPDDKYPPTLKKSGDEWKMDLKVMSSDPQFGKMKEAAKKAVPLLDSFTKDVEAGKYATVSDASLALFQTLGKLASE
jgi:hypothetical protein